MFGIFKYIGLGILSFLCCAIIICMSFFSASIFAKGDNTKDRIINVYDTFLQSFGLKGISKDKELQGKREFGTDKYVGTYNANYDNYTGEETIFGGTALNRKNGDHISLKIKLEKESGNIDVINKLGNSETSLISDTGEYEDIIYIKGMSYYLTIKLNNFKGNVSISAE